MINSALDEGYNKCLISYFMKLGEVYIISACFNHMHVHVIRYYINVADISQLNSKTLKLESLKKKTTSLHNIVKKYDVSLKCRRKTHKTHIVYIHVMLNFSLSIILTRSQWIYTRISKWEIPATCTVSPSN